jgi:low affinity Fe/Cu permease
VARLNVAPVDPPGHANIMRPRRGERAATPGPGNRDTRALRLKLDEVIRSVADARTQLLGLERLSDEELSKIEEEFEQLRDDER